MQTPTNDQVTYDESNIVTLDWKEHIRLRPGMYIGKLGDGSSADDGIYVLVKEILDNSIDEFTMGNGRSIELEVSPHRVRVRDYGRGIPLGKVIECVSNINTGGKYDSKAFQKSVGLNGVGTKAANALSKYFAVHSFRDGNGRKVEFKQGVLIADTDIVKASGKTGTEVIFEPDETIFRNYHFLLEYVQNLIKNYTYLNSGLTLVFNGQKFVSLRGLYDLLTDKVSEESQRYPIIHLKEGDIEVAITHTDNYGEEYYTFVNGQYTTQGGTHLAAFREGYVKTIREFYKKDFDATDIRASIAAAVSVRIQEPVFESQTKTKLGSTAIAPEGASIKNWLSDFLKYNLDNYLHKNPAVAEAILKRILQSERERKEIAGIKKLANEKAKKANLHNKKLRDCRVHLNEGTSEERLNSTIFITEGDSASGSLTKSRDVRTQAVFSLRGKPLNAFPHQKKVVYENEEFNLLQHALNIEDGIDGLRYQKVVIATDADHDGMHIRLLILTFFLKFFPELVKRNHVFILETPLFRVRNKKETLYCYSEKERDAAVKKLGSNPEITRFKGLGEISPDEFGAFIGNDIKLEPVFLSNDSVIAKTLSYYMGNNTMERQNFIIENLVVEKDTVEV